MTTQISAEDRLKRIPRVPQLWYIDGIRITGWLLEEIWPNLDWAAAWTDPGPSPAGNPGPYYHVPCPQEETTHRLYPKRFALRMSEAALKKVGTPM